MRGLALGNILAPVREVREGGKSSHRGRRKWPLRTEFSHMLELLNS
jgi:hypothetical protein